MSLRKLLAYSTIAFSAVLAVVVGNRMSAEAMAVLIGVVCGVVASIPMSAIILAMSRRGRPSSNEGQPAPTRQPVYVVTGPAAPQPPTWAACPQPYPLPAVPTRREYRIIGEESLQ